MGMPRFFRRGVAPSVALNLIAQEVDLQGLTCKVRRSTGLTVASAVDTIVPWQVESWDTFGGGMWDQAAPTYIVIRYPGIYDAEAQLRCPTAAAAAYAAGVRASKILLNSTDVFSTDPNAGPQTSRIEDPRTTAEGNTITLSCTMICQAGDRVYLNCFQNSGSPITMLSQDFGGSYLTVSRRSAAA